jgi:hypothetical protein
MARGYKTGGAISGTSNHKTHVAIDRLDALGRDPIAGLAKLELYA